MFFVAKDAEALYSQPKQDLELPVVKIMSSLLQNNRMRRTRDLFKKTGDIKGTFHANMGMVKDKNGSDLKKQDKLREVSRIHRRTVQKKVLMTQTTTMMWSLT